MGWLTSDAGGKRCAVWALFAASLYGLRSFYSLVLTTWILTLIGSASVSTCEAGWEALRASLPKRIPSWARVQPPRFAFCALYIAAFLGVLGTMSVITLPKVIREGQFVVQRVSQSEDPVRLWKEGARLIACHPSLRHPCD